MRKAIILPIFLFASCAGAFRQQAIEYAMGAWETLDEAFFSWAMVQPSIVEYLVDQGKKDEARKIFNTFKLVVGEWIKIKDEVEAILVKAAKAGQLEDPNRLNELFNKARKILHNIGALKRMP